MKMKRLIGLTVQFLTASLLAGDGISLESQYSAVSATVTLYRTDPSGFGEALLSRQSSDSSTVIGNRSASITTVAEAGGVRQTASDAIEVGLTNSITGVTVRFETAIDASFLQDDAAEVRAGSTSVEVRSDFQLRFRLNRPHRMALNVTPVGNRSLVGHLQSGIQTQNVGGSSTLSFPLTSAGPRTQTARLEPGVHDLTINVFSTGWGSFHLDQGELSPFAGDVGVLLLFQLEPIDEEIVGAGRIEIAPPIGGRVSLALSELIPGRPYRVERGYSLDGGTWQFVRDVYSPSSNATITDAFDAVSNAVFYRLTLLE